MRYHEMSGVFDFWKKKTPKGYVPPVGSAGLDLYAVLGVSPNASSDEVRSAYRRLARKFHPDTNPGDPLAARRFLEISKANDILTNPDLRDRYDNARRVASGAGERPGVQKGLIVPREIKEGLPPREETQKKRKPQPKAPWDIMFDESVESLHREGSMFDVFGPSRSVESRPIDWERMFPAAVKITPPTAEQVLEGVKTLPLKDIWDLVRKNRTDPGFQVAGIMYVAPIAGSGADPVEADLARLIAVPFDELAYYAERKGLHRLWEKVLGPLAEEAVYAIESLKPSDIPGAFYLDWAPTGKTLDLFYTEA